jgi:predicted TIM-barrel fold metal-dependent hydrolase
MRSFPFVTDLTIVDAHVHFWDITRNYVPWLCDEPPIAFRYGDYSGIRRNYLPDDYRADAARHRVMKTVYVETEWHPSSHLDETRWVEQLIARYGMPTVMVASARLDGDDVERVLASLASFPFVRGIRHKPRVASSPASVVRGAPGSMSDPKWRAGFALLERYGLSFDLQVPYWHLREALELACDFPDASIILDHAGLPADRSPQGIAAWREAMRALARAHNVTVKVSGLGQPDRPWTLEHNRALVLDTIDIFGVERCMFASNFPVDKLVTSFDTLMSGYKAMVNHRSLEDQRRLFHDNAVRIYRLGDQ